MLRTSFVVSVGDQISSASPLHCDVTQGSIFGLLPFYPFMSLDDIMYIYISTLTMFSFTCLSSHMRWLSCKPSMNAYLTLLIGCSAISSSSTTQKQRYLSPGQATRLTGFNSLSWLCPHMYHSGPEM